MASILLPAVFGAIFYRHLPSPVRVLTLFLFGSVLTEGIGYVCFLLKANNMPIFHLDTFLQITCVAIIYYQLFQVIQHKLLMVFVYLCFAVFTFVDLCFFTSIFEPNTLGGTIASILVIAICLFYLFHLRRHSGLVGRVRNYRVMLSVSLLIFFIGSLLVSVYSKNLMQGEVYKFFVIHSVLNIALNITYTVIIWYSVGLRKG